MAKTTSQNNKMIRVTGSHSPCSKCKYRVKSVNGSLARGCNYISITGKSRVFKDGRKVVPDGMCDKFEKGSALKTEAKIIITKSDRETEWSA